MNDKEQEKIIKILARELKFLKKKINILKSGRILEELNLSAEDLAALGIENNNKGGKKQRILTEEEIKNAQSQFNTASACASHLGVHYQNYKKWAEKYGIFKKNPWRKGDRKTKWSTDKGKYPLNEILQGKYPNYKPDRFKDLLFKTGIKKKECERCQLHEERITDGKVPLLINFKDGNNKNHSIDNVEILCYNCMFLTGRGYIRNGKITFINNS